MTAANSMPETMSIPEELRRIAKRNGGLLLAEDVVEAARDQSSPLHDSFTWDDDEAAQKWRLHQARNLIRVTVEWLNAPGKEPIRVRPFVSLTPDRTNDGGGYRSIISVMANKDHRRQLLDDAIAEMDRFRAKYESLSELADVFAAMRRVRK